MPANPLTRHAPWRQIIVVALVVPIAIGLALTAFAWPAARTAPHDLPIGVVAPGAAADRLTTTLGKDDFDVHRYADRAAATDAIENRDVYAAIVAGPDTTTVLTASAASPVVATAIQTQMRESASGPVRFTDVVPLSKDDPRGAVFGSALLPLLLGGMIGAVFVALLLKLRPAWRTITALVVTSATTGLAAWVVAQGWLGALPGHPVATWAALSLTVLAISSTVAGLYELVGTPGIGLGAVLMIFLGNPFSGTTSAPDLLPSGVRTIGQLLPPGAGANLLRSTAYFDGNGAAGHVLVLACWVVGGMTAVVVGHVLQNRKAAQPGKHEPSADHVPVRQLVTQG